MFFSIKMTINQNCDTFELKISNDFYDFHDFEGNKQFIKRNIRLLLGKHEEITGCFPSQKVKKTANSSSEYNYQNNIFKGNSSLFRSFYSENSQKEVKTPVKQEETLFILKKNSNENADFFIDDEFNTIERKKITAFDLNYSFENNKNDKNRSQSII